MKRWKLTAGATDASGLVLEEVPTPVPGPGEVRVRVEALSLNYRDQLVVAGGFARLPDRDLVPLSDVAGVVDAVGAGVSTWTVGDHVTNLHFRGWEDGVPEGPLGFGMGAADEDGVLAEHVLLPADQVARAPRNLDSAEAATLPVAAVTAWNALFEANPVGAGSKTLVIGSGGVSVFALQLALAAGSEVFAVMRQAHKGRQLEALGAKGFVDSTSTPDWGAAVLELSGGVDKVVDVVGTATLNQSMASLRPAGEVALVGLFDLDGPAVDGVLLMSRGVRLRGVGVGSARMHRDVVGAVERHDVHPVVHRRFAFSDAPAAFRAQLGRDLVGKVVIEVP
ncbi:zinc-dependent alcohol dehydrogenase family protein [Umezawaea tangerina]|uniref:D-arabinose 1-dehydrogenase-like Zn-dependent alcohol dehydrogenase n=1 Tax=Umezawaea tangerina TaxID=84725 RepID=A0A2T0THJ1_9PSEU|nr:NAD(P)-dependent alcohol dehydrogenase [Umezawaea tangerina]PRY45164.1 D-arabinose 1-dehydrogenase-like Zn-dependent alcohol dehydrogenase [Umezawaea tangerina]